jgi:hypothetical protein
MTAELPPCRLRLEQVAKLKVGDTLALPLNSPIEFKCGWRGCCVSQVALHTRRPLGH